MKHCIALLVLFCSTAAIAAELDELVKQSDLIVLGRVVRIEEGQLDPDLLKMNVNFRTDVASIIAIEVLKGDPALQKVQAGFPGFPKEGELTAQKDQTAVWLLAKSDSKYFTIKGIVPENRLGTVRRAVRAAAGVTATATTQRDRTARMGDFMAELEGGKTETARRLAAFQLGEMGAIQAVPSLIKALNDDAPSVRVAASLALQKVTGHSSQADFEFGSIESRAKAQTAWKNWWNENDAKTRDEILAAAVEAGEKPQPDYQRAIEGLALSENPAYAPLMTEAFDSAMSAHNSLLTASIASYFGRVKEKSAVRRLAGVLNPEVSWPADEARASAAVAIGSIVGEKFGTGAAAVLAAREWWASNRGNY